VKDILGVARAAALEAGDFLLNNFGKIAEIESKKDNSLATNLDKEAEAMIVDRVRAAFPAHGIVGEEGAALNPQSDYAWIIDPLDGTHNFIRGLNIFGVSIGVTHKNKFVAGAIYMPQEKELYYGEAGGGAFKNDAKISVSSTAGLGECSISFDSSIRYAPEVMTGALADIAVKVFNVRMLGSSARQLSYVAEGKLDVAIEFHDRPWDFAAGAAIVAAAGGKMIALSGEELKPGDVGYIMGNPCIFDEAKTVIFSAIERYRRAKGRR